MKESLIVIFAIIIVLQFLNMLLSNKKKREDNKADDKMPYKKKLLLTKNEWNFYKGILEICSEKNLHIIAKVRLADLVEIEKGLDKKQWQKYFNKIKNKHIDFVLCNPENLKVIALVELDDKSHNRNDRIERDNFISKLCVKVGYKLIRVNSAKQFKTKITNL